MEDAAEWTATGLENQGMGNCRGTLRDLATIPPSSTYPPEAEKRGAVLITQK
ncbi:hypothetical protein [Nostoc sp. ChiQUE01b]|uniref:hypothetical protein n=1 Tax=Nostoc sp. ChiQUE01b TaxID=3075376 RepID=UPI002AD29D60|nr:hypothetical protein [Nostoc sp. ChiQUE01b]MDZ8258735.1 hypothetical protein [Nostoc sp. ChiQUE01b]